MVLPHGYRWCHAEEALGLWYGHESVVVAADACDGKQQRGVLQRGDVVVHKYSGPQGHREIVEESRTLPVICRAASGTICPSFEASRQPSSSEIQGWPVAGPRLAQWLAGAHLRVSLPPAAHNRGLKQVLAVAVADSSEDEHVFLREVSWATACYDLLQLGAVGTFEIHPRQQPHWEAIVGELLGQT